MPTLKVNRAASGSCLTIMAGERSLRNLETKPNSNLSINSRVNYLVERRLHELADILRVFAEKSDEKEDK